MGTNYDLQNFDKKTSMAHWTLLILNFRQATFREGNIGCAIL